MFNLDPDPCRQTPRGRRLKKPFFLIVFLFLLKAVNRGLSMDLAYIFPDYFQMICHVRLLHFLRMAAARHVFLFSHTHTKNTISHLIFRQHSVFSKGLFCDTKLRDRLTTGQAGVLTTNTKGTHTRSVSTVW